VCKRKSVADHYLGSLCHRCASASRWQTTTWVPCATGVQAQVVGSCKIGGGPEGLL